MTDKEVEKRLAAKDTMNTGKLEQQAALKKEQEDGEAVVDTEEAKEVLRKSWLGQKIDKKDVIRYSCKNCTAEYETVESPPETCEKCGNRGFEREGIVDKVEVWVQVTENTKMNRDGFSSLWGTLLPYLTRAAQMSYLREGNIEKMLKATIRDLWSEILANFDDYEMSPEHSKQVVGEALVIMVGAINKSRDGRGMVNQEKTTVEKIARRVGIGDEEESTIFGGGSIL